MRQACLNNWYKYLVHDCNQAGMITMTMFCKMFANTTRLAKLNQASLLVIVFAFFIVYIQRISKLKQQM